MTSTGYPNPDSSSGSRDNRGLIYGLLITALLGTWGYIIYDKSQTKEEIERKDLQYAALDSSKSSLQKEYEDALLRLEGMTSTNATLDSPVRSRDVELTGLKGRIRSLVSKQNATASDLKEAQNLISQLNGKIDGYLEEIERLQTINEQLTEQNQGLTANNLNLEKDLSSTRDQKKQAENKVDLGSTLHASNFRITAVDVRNSGREKETGRAKRADKLRLSFDLDENYIAASGNKDIYVALIDPSGKVIREEALGSGVFNTRRVGTKEFTTKISVNYVQGERKNVSFDLLKTDKYVAGNYRIDVYQNGMRIGEGTIALK
ncbi:MAG: hypothetical protein FJX89_11735 [Bacteroidetes bacterium]|nr:hypothetical protein [Bacteroidota bacterium]